MRRFATTWRPCDVSSSRVSHVFVRLTYHRSSSYCPHSDRPFAVRFPFLWFSFWFLSPSPRDVSASPPPSFRFQPLPLCAFSSPYKTKSVDTTRFLIIQNPYLSKSDIEIVLFASFLQWGGVRLLDLDSLLNLRVPRPLIFRPLSSLLRLLFLTSRLLDLRRRSRLLDRRSRLLDLLRRLSLRSLPPDRDLDLEWPDLANFVTSFFTNHTRFGNKKVHKSGHSTFFVCRRLPWTSSGFRLCPGIWNDQDWKREQIAMGIIYS